MMKKIVVFLTLGLLLMVGSVAAAIDFTDWKQIEIDESQTNSSSTTVFTVMMPPGYTFSTVDTSSGPITTFVDESDPISLISISIIDNPIHQQLNDANSEEYLDNFMIGANITPSTTSEPIYLNDGGIVNYGTSGEDVAGVYVLSTDEKVIQVAGFYKTAEQATEGVENLAMIAGTIQITPEETK